MKSEYCVALSYSFASWPLKALSRKLERPRSPPSSAAPLTKAFLGAGRLLQDQANENATAMSFKIERLANSENTAVLRVCGRRAKLFTGTLKNG
jgi:hypothetical protein